MTTRCPIFRLVCFMIPSKRIAKDFSAGSAPHSLSHSVNVIFNFSFIFYNIPSRFYSEWKTGCFQIDFYMPERYFSWRTYKQPAWIMKKACRLSIFLPEFLTFLQSLTSVESDIRRNKEESRGIWESIWGYFQGFRHSVSVTTVFTAMTTVFVAVNCRVHLIWKRSSWQ